MSGPFELYYREYDSWFEKNKNIYLSELNLIKSFISDGLNGLEIGVGSGRFAKPLGIKIGVEPSEKMAEMAQRRNLKVIKAFAEELPFENESFDFALLVTTICFLGEPLKALKEAYRVIKSKGFILIGFVPLDSYLGEIYVAKKAASHFYKTAHFYTKEEVRNFLEEAGFKNQICRQTLFVNTNDYVQEYREGDDRGGFIVIKGEKS
ncbi:MAG: class I SAM-dependent methyltransferase [Brevinematia bacterium]